MASGGQTEVALQKGAGAEEELIDIKRGHHRRSISRRRGYCKADPPAPGVLTRLRHKLLAESCGLTENRRRGGSATNGLRPGSKEENVPNSVTWFEIMGGDGNALHSFYKSVFDWKLSDPMVDMGNYSMMDGEGHGIGGGVGAEMPGQGGRVTVYIEVPDPQASLDKVMASGGKMVMPVTQVTPDVIIAMFTDPVGNVVGLLKGDGSH